MSEYTKLWEFKTANFRVTLSYDYDYDIDLSWYDTGETLEKLESGELGAYVFRVAVYDQNGEVIGADYLGGLIYADPEKFIDHRVGRCGSYFHDMVRQAISHARKRYNQPRARLRKAKGSKQ